MKLKVTTSDDTDVQVTDEKTVNEKQAFSAADDIRLFATLRGNLKLLDLIDQISQLMEQMELERRSSHKQATITKFFQQ